MYNDALLVFDGWTFPQRCTLLIFFFMLAFELDVTWSNKQQQKNSTFDDSINLREQGLKDA